MSQNFLEHYAATWQRSLTWAERRLSFLHALGELLSQPGMVELFREWAEDREKMHQLVGRSAEIGSAHYVYWQGAAIEAGMLVDNWQAEIKALAQAREAFAKQQEAEEQQEETE